MKVRLRDVATVINGVTYKPSDIRYPSCDGSIPILRATNIQNGALDLSDTVYIDVNKVAQQQMLQNGDIIICASSGSKNLVGKAAQITIVTPLSFGSFCKVVRPNNINPEYLYFFFQSPTYRHLISEASIGANINNIRNSHILDLQIPVPNINKQKNICEHLGSLSNQITKRNQQAIILDQLVKSRFMEMFGEWPANSKNWPTGQIKDIVIDVKYGSSRPSSRDGKYPYLRMNNITYSGQLDLSDIKKITIPNNELENCSARKGDVLFNRTNSRELVGKTCVYNQEQPMVIAGFIIRVRLNETLMSPVFLSSFLNTDFSKHMLMHKCKSAIGQANINAQEMKNIKLYIPPLPLQQQFAAFVEKVDKSKFIVGARLAGRLCRKILTKLSLSEADYD